MAEAFRLQIWNGETEESKKIDDWIGFPCSPEEFKSILQVDGFSDEQIKNCVITGYLPAFHEYSDINDFFSSIDHPYKEDGYIIREAIDELNYLAHFLCEFGETDRAAFAAALEAGEHTKNLVDIINLAQNVECYNVVEEIYDWEDYGKYVAKEECNVNIDFLGDLEGYVDFEGFGEDFARSHGGYLLDNKFLETNCATFVAKYDGNLANIPDRFRISLYADEKQFLDYNVNNIQTSPEINIVQLKERMKEIVEDNFNVKDGTIEIDSDYRNELSGFAVKEIVETEKPIQVFEGMLRGWDANYIWDRMIDIVKENLSDAEEELFINNITEMIDFLYETYKLSYPDEDFNKSVKVNVLLDKVENITESVRVNSYDDEQFLDYKVKEALSLANSIDRFFIAHDKDYAARYPDGRVMSISEMLVNGDLEYIKSMLNNLADDILLGEVTEYEKKFIKDNYLANAEKHTEQNFNQIDGLINNESPKKEEKPSIRLMLKIIVQEVKDNKDKDLKLPQKSEPSL